MKNKTENWVKDFRKGFAEYSRHERLNQLPFIDWAEDFIRKLLEQASKEERERIQKIAEKHFEQLHGGGNGRRLVIQFIESLQ